MTIVDFHLIINGIIVNCGSRIEVIIRIIEVSKKVKRKEEMRNSNFLESFDILFNSKEFIAGD